MSLKHCSITADGKDKDLKLMRQSMYTNCNPEACEPFPSKQFGMSYRNIHMEQKKGWPIAIRDSLLMSGRCMFMEYREHQMRAKETT